MLDRARPECVAGAQANDQDCRVGTVLLAILFLSSPCLLSDGLFRDALASKAVASVAVHLTQPLLTSRVLLHNLTAFAATLRLEA